MGEHIVRAIAIAAATAVACASLVFADEAKERSIGTADQSGTPRMPRELAALGPAQVCVANDCRLAGKGFSVQQVLGALHRLLSANDGLEYKICESDKRSRECIAENYGHTVFALVFPARGTQSSGTIRHPRVDPSGNAIRVSKSDPKQYRGSPVTCADHGGTITANASGEIVLTDDPYPCSWGTFGAMTAEFSFTIESIDLDKGRISGFWSHKLTGTGHGSGTGFAALQFQKGMARGENWLQPITRPTELATGPRTGGSPVAGGPPTRHEPTTAESTVQRPPPAAGMEQSMPNWYRPLIQGEYAEIVAMIEKEVQSQPKPRSTKLLPLCIAYSRLHQFSKAVSCFERLAANVRAGDTDAFEHDRPDITIGLYGAVWCFMCTEKYSANRGTVLPPMYLARAELHLAMREYNDAVAVANEYLKLLPRRYADKDDFKALFQTQPLALMGIAYALSGNRQAAEKAIRALEGLRTAVVEAHKLYGIARIHLALGDFRSAHKLLGSYDPPTVSWLDQLFGSRLDAAFKIIPLWFLKHKTELEVGETAAAKAGFDKLLAEREAKENSEIHWMSLYERGRIAALEGQPAAAIEFWKRAIEIIEQLRSAIDTEVTKIGFVGDKQAVYQALVGVLFAQNRHAEAFDFVERAKARALVDMLAGKRDFAVAAPDPDKIRALLASAYTAELDSRASVSTLEFQRSAQLRSSALATVREQSADLASLVSVASVPVPEIQSRLPEDEALVEYYYDEKSLYAFVLSRVGLRAAKLDATGLEADVRELRKAVSAPTGAGHEAMGRKLYARLFQPLEGLGLGKKLVIVAHGALHYLPFAVLRDDTGYLIDRYSLRFLPSASVIRYLRPSGAVGRAGILAFGNPDLGDPKLDLRFAQDEVVAVVQKVPQSRALVRKEATESALRQYATGFSYLHFATHGEFNADAPLRSALLLAKDERSDGLLTVDKLYSIRLDADLVTLSACETGLGRVASGDDVVGLTRGFLYAGASTVVASLWKVDDRATSVMMTRFYDELKAGDKREALRTAQLATRAQFPHPFFWAAFQLTGTAQ